MRKFLKRFVFVQASGNRIIIGNNKQIIYVRNNEKNNLILSKLTGDGLELTNKKTASLIQKLEANGWLTDSPTFLDRTSLFFETLNVNFSTEVKQTRILVLGAGGAGGTLLYMLAQFGFSDLHILDYDIVEASDCIKTMVYRQADIGMSKVEALRASIKNNLGIDITTHFLQIHDIDNLRALVRGITPSLIINAIDPNPIHKLNLNQVCFELSIPFLPLHYSYELFTVGPFIVPKLTSCYNSIRESILRASGKRFDISVVNKLYTNYLVHPSISILINTVASIGAKEIIFFLSNRLDLVLSLNNVLTMSIVDMVGELTELSCTANCPVCYPNNPINLPIS